MRDARAHWAPVWVVVDGSTDGIARRPCSELARSRPGLRVIVLAPQRRQRRGALDGLREAQRAGFTHALTMDSGRPASGRLHPRSSWPPRPRRPRPWSSASRSFDASAPRIRVRGRRISNWWANVETLWAGIGDSLFGFRVYPIAPLLASWSQPLDAALRLRSGGGRAAELARRAADQPARAGALLPPEEGGVSHFNYWRDNVLLTWMYLRLVTGGCCACPGCCAVAPGSVARSAAEVLVQPDELAEGRRQLRRRCGRKGVDAETVLEPRHENRKAQRVEARAGRAAGRRTAGRGGVPARLRPAGIPR